ncbi:MAG TPA: hypothetical protein VJZ75_04975 [Candidatus Bathyarchaeia archaeon]|nr:hypothetical protein [Candidatus Bathyarchaeia archaeon]
MYNEIKAANVKVASISENGLATMVFHLNGKASGDFVDWFRSPAGHTWTSNLQPTMCTIQRDRIQLQVNETSVEAVKPMMDGWIERANEHARTMDLERERKEKINQEHTADLEKKRQELQRKINRQTSSH